MRKPRVHRPSAQEPGFLSARGQPNRRSIDPELAASRAGATHTAVGSREDAMRRLIERWQELRHQATRTTRPRATLNVGKKIRKILRKGKDWAASDHRADDARQHA